MPDRRQGYVRRGAGILPSDPTMADRYRTNANYDTISFRDEHHRTAIASIIDAATHIECRVHYIATDSTHIHALVSWNCERTWQQNRISLKRALTISFKEMFGKRPWLGENASRKQVCDGKHFDYLVSKYLPSHAGRKWCEPRGLLRPARRSSPAIKELRERQ
jgi:hypothetical protein